LPRLPESGLPADNPGRRRPGFLALYFVLCLLFLTVFFIKCFKGIQGDGVYYYSYTVSLLWDGDLDLKDQFDHPDPRSPGETLTRGLYALDMKTGKAFSLFNPGTGLLMLPATLTGKVLDRWTGGRHPDPFDLYYQRFAGFTAVLLSALAMVILCSILNRYYSFGAAVCLPPLFLLGTNWLFYASVFATWSHVYALFLFACLIWSCLNFLEKRNGPAAVLFGLAGGLFFTTRNLSALTFLLLFLFSIILALRNLKTFRPQKTVVSLALVGLFFLVGSAPQLVFNGIIHGSPFRTGWQAASTAPEIFGHLEKGNFKALDIANLQFLYSNLVNSDDGLFYFHPLYLVGLFGLLLLRHRHPLFQSLNNLLLAGLFLFWLVDASYFDNWFNRAAGSGFGHRRFLDMLPVFVFGAANILEWSRSRKITKYLVLLLYSALTAGAAVLLYNFLAHYPVFYAVRDSFFGLYKYLLANRLALLVFSVAFLILLSLIKIEKEAATWARHSPLFIIGCAVLFFLPAFVFRSSPERDRQRFQDRRGFFLMYSLTPLVRLPGHYWGFPENMARPMLFSSANIELPAPVLEDDILQFKLTPLSREGETSGIMSVYLGRESIGRLALRKGTQICQFRVPRSLPAQRLITIRLENEKVHSPAALFHEGRVVFQEWDEPPFGHVDLPPDKYVLGSEGVVVEGWALDDRGVDKVIIKREPLPEEKTFPRDEDGLITLGNAAFRSGTRPDVEKVFVLYPAIDRAGWVFWLDRRLLPKCDDGSFIIHAIAADGRGQRVDIGKKEVICPKGS
jgi:xanthosine utilization system XapX-like protein